VVVNKKLPIFEIVLSKNNLKEQIGNDEALELKVENRLILKLSRSDVNTGY